MTGRPAMTPDDTDSPLNGVRVADLSVTVPGPYATQVLRRLGAAVLHLEPPGGDPLRYGAPAAHAFLAEGKESVVVNLKDPGDRDLALRLLAGADVVVEGWRPGVAGRLGVGYEDVRAHNPAVVYCSLSGYGQAGPMTGRPGHDINYTAASGTLDLLRPDGMPVGDLAGGGAAVIRILAELTRAQRTGRGRHLDVSITGTLADWLGALGGREWRQFARILDTPHYAAYPTRDGERVLLGIAPMEQAFWAELITAMGRPEWAVLAHADRMARRDELRAYLTAAFGALTAAEVADRLGPVDTCWSLARAPGAAEAVAGRLPDRPGAVPVVDEHGAAYRTTPVAGD
ncbi:MAG TPA: CaiB/BaiF CoA-transferase family protein [Actinoplanes sp.]|nr:CaiB/BaiF CoA-transferase family protein [Actinoplanes sp.]